MSKVRRILASLIELMIVTLGPDVHMTYATLVNDKEYHQRMINRVVTGAKMLTQVRKVLK